MRLPTISAELALRIERVWANEREEVDQVPATLAPRSLSTPFPSKPPSRSTGKGVLYGDRLTAHRFRRKARTLPP